MATAGAVLRPKGFEEDRLARQVLCLQLFLDDEAVLLVAHQQRCLHAVEGQALDGLLEQGCRRR